MDKFRQAFQNNFFQTKEFADFCAKVAEIPLKERIVGNENIYTLKNKNISIGDYSDSFCQEMREKNIQYLRVLPEINGWSGKASYMEYSILHKTTYEKAFENYRTSFFHGLREGKKYPHTTRIVRKPSGGLIAEIYGIYATQMRRHNSFIFPLPFFKEFMACPSSFLFLIERERKIIAYFCCFQNEDNIYASIGGGHPDYFSRRSSNKLYDELIKYACRNGLNIHLGIGEHGLGYQKFKQNAGLVCYKTERFPDNDKLVWAAASFLRFKLAGKLLRLVSANFPHLIVYLAMPFT